MKTTKRILALLMAMTLVIALGATAFAANTDTFTIEVIEGKVPVDGRTFTVYQIFTGDLYQKPGATASAPAETTLSNIKFGTAYTAEKTAADGTNPATYYEVGDAVPQDILDALTDAKTFAADLMAEDNPEFTGTVYATLDSTNNYKKTNVPAGYYLIVDDTEKIPSGETRSQYMVYVVEDVRMAPKADTTKVDKTIQTALNCTKADPDAGDYVEGHTHTAECYNWEKTDKKKIGETEQFKVVTNVASDAEEYKSFFFIIGDTLSKGLTFNPDSVEVYAGDTKLTAVTNYTLDSAPTNGRTFEIALVDAANYAGQTITVYYTALVNANAVIKDTGNPNTVTVDYSNDPYDDSKGNTDKPGFPDDRDTWVNGETPKSKTYTYVTGIEIQKVDEKGEPLTGAEFTITGTTVSSKLVYKEVYEANDAGEYWQLKVVSGKDPQYTTVAPVFDHFEKKTDRNGGYVLDLNAETTADGYKKMNDNEIYRVATAEELENENVDLYAFVTGNDTEYESTTKKYVKTFKWETVTTPVDDFKAVVTVDEDGIAILDGLDAGTYTISETVVPDGYNAIKDMTLVINWAAPTTMPTDGTDPKCTWTATLDGTSLVYNDEFRFELEIQNQSGAVLPETGGIGTTIFYVVGGIMLVGAGVLLITKKRMSHAE